MLYRQAVCPQFVGESDMNLRTEHNSPSVKMFCSCQMVKTMPYLSLHQIVFCCQQC